MINFKDIQINSNIFVLDKQNFDLQRGHVTHKGFPQMQMNPTTAKAEMLVDVSIAIGDKKATYAMPENAAVCYAGNMVFATDGSIIATEIENEVNAAKQRLANADRDKELIRKSDNMLAELNPAYKEKQEAEARISKIEDSVSELKNSQTEFFKKMTSLMNQLKEK